MEQDTKTIPADMFIYKNGFRGKLHNARVEARQTHVGDWILIFRKLSFNDYTEKQKSYFDVVVERFGMIYTRKYLRLSDDAMHVISSGFFTWYNKTQQDNG